MKTYLVLAVCLSLFSLSALGQDAEVLPVQPAAAATETKEPASQLDPALQLMLASPQKTLASFIRAAEEGEWLESSKCMEFNALVDPESKKTRAYELKQILDGVGLDALQLPDEAEYDGNCILSDYATEVETGEFLSDEQKADFDLIVISKAADGTWRFDAGTVQHIETIYEHWKPQLEETLPEDAGPKPTSVWLAEQFPEALHQKRFLIADYMWICLAAVVAMGFLMDAIVGFLAINLSQAWFQIERSAKKDEAVRQLWKPVGLLLQALVWYHGTTRIGLPSWVTEYLLLGLNFFTVFAAIWVLFRLIDVLSEFFSRRAEKTTSKFDDLLVPLLSRILKVVATLFGVLICAETFNLPIKGLLGGLGLGGMALALASKDAVSNLFGSFTVLIDRPFEIGDWVITEDIEGTVEQVGFRSTRIRTFYNSLITLPNSRLTTAVVDNMGRRRYRRVKTTLGVQYNTTPEQIDAFCEGIRELIRQTSATRKDYFHVYFNGFNNSSLDILIYFFLRVPDWSSELREKHKLFTKILKLAQELNVEFAFPTRTLHMQPAEAEVPPPRTLAMDDAESFGRESAIRIANG